MRQAARRSPARQHGVALAIVVWFIAAMSLLVGGIVYQAKLETRAVQMHIAQAKVAAAGDGAIALMLASTTSPSDSIGSAASELVFRLGDLPVLVQLVPLGGLIDLNSAPRELLVPLLKTTGVPAEEAELLADNVIKWRSPSLAGPGRRLDSIENLIQVEGFDRLRIDALRDLVRAGSSASAGFDPRRAPPDVLAVFAGQDPDRAAVLAGRQNRGDAPRLIKAGEYRVDAVVDYGGRRWLRRRWVKMGTGGASALPWRFVRTEAPRVVGQQ
jgi:hypothetical protein